MNIPFFKYQGTGNDFVIIDHFEKPWLHDADEVLIKHWCDRKFGVGADGLMILQPSTDADFRLDYYNADGKKGSLCGNGSRCAVSCMHHLGRVQDTCRFVAYDGLHEARISPDGRNIEVHMADVKNVESGRGFYLLDTGSPHYVTHVEDLSDLDVVDVGKKIRYSEQFRETGVNVNFVENSKEALEVRTYERGVEDETLSCGTGVTAVALAHALRAELKGDQTQTVQTLGGTLTVKFHLHDGHFSNVWLCGPAELVFEGVLSWEL